MFRGLACFSPTVTQNVRLLWQSNRGTIASSLEEFDQVEWFFGTPADHEWVSRLLERGITVMRLLTEISCILTRFDALGFRRFMGCRLHPGGMLDRESELCFSRGQSIAHRSSWFGSHAQGQAYPCGFNGVEFGR